MSEEVTTREVDRQIPVHQTGTKHKLSPPRYRVISKENSKKQDRRFDKVEFQQVPLLARLFCPPPHVLCTRRKKLRELKNAKNNLAVYSPTLFSTSQR
jgi:hypothetical protein